MSSDYSVLDKRIRELHEQETGLRPNHHFALRVEKLVADTFGLKQDELLRVKKYRAASHPRFVLFSILWQPSGFRSLTWLSQRYGYKDHSSIRHGIQKVEDDMRLKNIQISIMSLLFTQLEIELFGFRRPEHASFDQSIPS